MLGKSKVGLGISGSWFGGGRGIQRWEESLGMDWELDAVFERNCVGKIQNQSIVHPENIHIE